MVLALTVYPGPSQGLAERLWGVPGPPPGEGVPAWAPRVGPQSGRWPEWLINVMVKEGVKLTSHLEGKGVFPPRQFPGMVLVGLTYLAGGGPEPMGPAVAASVYDI